MEERGKKKQKRGKWAWCIWWLIFFFSSYYFFCSVSFLQLIWNKNQYIVIGKKKIFHGLIEFLLKMVKKLESFTPFVIFLFAREKKKIKKNKKKRSQLPKISKIDLLDKPWNYPKDYSTPPKLLFQQQAFVFEKQHFVPILSFCCFNQSLVYGRWNCLKLNEAETQALPILLT